MDTIINGKVPESQSFSSEFASPGTAANIEIDIAPLYGEDDCNLVILERTSIINYREKRGATLEELANHVHLSHAAVAIRVRRLREDKPGKSKKSFVSSVKKGNQYLLYNVISLEAVQEVMRQRGISYETYLAKRKITPTPESNDSQGLELIEDLWEEESEQETEGVSNANYDLTTEISENTEETPFALGSGNISDSLSNPLVLQKTVALCLTEIVKLKQDNATLKEENTLVKQELAKLKIQVSELDQKLQESSHNQLLSTLDNLLSLNQKQNDKDRH